MNLIGFDRHFDYPHINVDTFVPRKPRVDRLGNIRYFCDQLAHRSRRCVHRSAVC